MYSIRNPELLDVRRDVKVSTPEREKEGAPKYPPDFVKSIGKRGWLVNARSIGRVQLPVSQPMNQAAGIVGNAVRLRVDVEIAHRFLFSQPVSVMNPADLSKRFQIPFDGLLGQDILSQFRSVRIDYKGHVIELEL